MTQLAGVFPIVPTIFHANGVIDLVGTRNVLEYIIGAGAAGVVFPGLASEYDMLSVDERIELTASLGGWIAGRVPFIVGASHADAAIAAQLAATGAVAGAVAAMILTPHKHASDPAAMAAYFNDIHEASGVAIMLQNAPAPMGVGLGVAQVAALASAVPGIRYVKEETQPSGHRITALMEATGAGVEAVFGGAGARYVIDELQRGAIGTMPACEVTEIHVAMLARHAKGDLQGARDLFERTLPLLSMQAVFRWRLTKAVLLRRGLIGSDHVRAAGPTLDAWDQRELDDLLARIADILPLDRVPGKPARMAP
ncbi:dihydrodipicolinate synthase family protein [Luteibacter aegosomatissinici]|uniref:dihydrodipicolinate synthase family protein n=1 Tax=Luteibacter aegosomatissinici TaxID=2911539 RepID=UPI001FFB546C|nr:dihydrodipicolinate synthase family protein [Luteibacter aegosomatissinici]UPG94591.1 dihydrodipicolinate synthase family protein [Luteibacter aegosomatissinici]